MGGREGYQAVVKLLLEKGANIEDKDGIDSQMPLLYAAMYGHEAIAKLLLEKGAKLQFEDKDGSTPLLWAIENRHEATVSLLENWPLDGITDGEALEEHDKEGKHERQTFRIYYFEALLNETGTF